MRLQQETAETTADYTYTQTALRHALRELEIDFKEGPKEFVMDCLFDESCIGHKKSLYMLHTPPLNSKRVSGTYHCFKCNAKGLFYGFVQRVTGWSPFKIGTFVRKYRATGSEPPEEREPPREMPKEALEQFAFRHPYCYERGLNEDTLRRYRIGYDREENDIIFPWFDRVGKLVVIKRRAVLTKYYRYDGEGFSLTTLLFGLHLVRQRSIVWICEGEFDAMYLAQIFREYHLDGHGAVALGGKYLHLPALKELLKKAPSLIVLALDGDEDGQAAAQVIARQLDEVGLPHYRLTYQAGAKDPNESKPQHIIDAITNITTHLDRLNASSAARYEAWKEQP
jgi:DNA primase